MRWTFFVAVIAVLGFVSEVGAQGALIDSVGVDHQARERVMDAVLEGELATHVVVIDALVTVPDSDGPESSAQTDASADSLTPSEEGESEAGAGEAVDADIVCEPESPQRASHARIAVGAAFGLDIGLGLALLMMDSFGSMGSFMAVLYGPAVVAALVLNEPLRPYSVGQLNAVAGFVGLGTLLWAEFAALGVLSCEGAVDCDPDPVVYGVSLVATAIASLAWGMHYASARPGLTEAETSRVMLPTMWTLMLGTIATMPLYTELESDLPIAIGTMAWTFVGLGVGEMMGRRSQLSSRHLLRMHRFGALGVLLGGVFVAYAVLPQAHDETYFTGALAAGSLSGGFLGGFLGYRTQDPCITDVSCGPAWNASPALFPDGSGGAVLGGTVRVRFQVLCHLNCTEARRTCDTRIGLIFGGVTICQGGNSPAICLVSRRRALHAWSAPGDLDLRHVRVSARCLMLFRRTLFCLSLLVLAGCSSTPEDESHATPEDTGVDADTEETVGPICGDGVIDEGEACDSAQLGDATCVTAGFELGDVACGPTCELDLSLCRDAVCGDGVREGGEGCDDGNVEPGDGCGADCVSESCGDGIRNNDEDCEGDDLGGADCSDLGFATGELSCAEDCVWDPSACASARCGDGVVTAPEACDDGNRADGDGCAFDCVVEVCGDGLILGDETCDGSDMIVDTCPGDTLGVAQCDDACALGDPLCSDASVCGNGVLELGEACDLGDENGGPDCTVSCESSTCGDGLLSVAEACDGELINRLTCADFGLLAGTLGCESCTLQLADCHHPICGDGVIEGRETCDDGGREPDDGCSPRCQLEDCGDGVIDIDERCDDGAENSNAPDGLCRLTCQPAACGDGVVDPGLGEACDLGVLNHDAVGSACHSDCQPPMCGDGILDVGEGCDEGDLNLDVPDATCRPGCILPSCGDGIPDSGEACDAGIANSDAPNADCRVDCSAAFCGDGIVDTERGELCDDGANNSDDADASCRLDCLSQRCGDGIVDTGEVCDDGNLVEGDACTTLCELPNMAPVAVASFTLASTLYAVSFDGFESDDPDGEIVDYQWTFGDGDATSGSEPAPGPFHFYPGPGTYTATLTVTDNLGATGEDAVEVVIGSAPTVAVDAAVTTQCAPFTTHFTAVGTDLDDNIVSYEWDPQDGSEIETTTDPVFTHTYGPVTGTTNYVATVTAIDAVGYRSPPAELTITVLPSVGGGTVQWIGGDGSVWSDANVWCAIEGPRVPMLGDIVTVRPGSADILLDGDTTIQELDLISGRLNLGGHTLTVNGNVTVPASGVLGGVLAAGGDDASIQGGVETLHVVGQNVALRGVFGSVDITGSAYPADTDELTATDLIVRSGGSLNVTHRHLRVDNDMTIEGALILVEGLLTIGGAFNYGGVGGDLFTGIIRTHSFHQLPTGDPFEPNIPELSTDPVVTVELTGAAGSLTTLAGGNMAGFAALKVVAGADVTAVGPINVDYELALAGTLRGSSGGSVSEGPFVLDIGGVWENVGDLRVFGPAFPYGAVNGPVAFYVTQSWDQDVTTSSHMAFLDGSTCVQNGSVVDVGGDLRFVGGGELQLEPGEVLTVRGQLEWGGDTTSFNGGTLQLFGGMTMMPGSSAFMMSSGNVILGGSAPQIVSAPGSGAPILWPAVMIESDADVTFAGDGIGMEDLISEGTLRMAAGASVFYTTAVFAAGSRYDVPASALIGGEVCMDAGAIVIGETSPDCVGIEMP